MTVRHGSSAWLWKITARSMLGPSITWPSTITVPSEGRSSPARMLSTVVLPQPEWPMTQTNSPRRIASQRFSNTVVSPPPGALKRLAMPSIEISLSEGPLTWGRSLGEGDEAGGQRQELVEDHAHHADHENG